MSRDQKEIELKFTAAPEALARLRGSSMLAALIEGGGKWARLVSTYYDTPEGGLAEAGLALRLREQAGKRIQGVKSRTGEAGVIERMEIECKLEPDDCFPIGTGDPRADEPVSALRDDLQPIARSLSDRWSALIKRGGAVIECAFDFGRVEGAGADGAMRAAPLAELELELLEGDPAALFDMARLILDEPCIRLGAETKLDAALRTGQGRLPGFGPRRQSSLNSEGSAEDALRAGILGCAERMITVAPAILDARHPEGVHQMRVALRQFRAVERVFRRPANDRLLRGLARRARDFARALSPARDWDVFVGETLPRLKGLGKEPEGFERLQARAEALRAEAWEAAIQAIGGNDFRALTLDLLEAGYLKSWRKGATREHQTNIQLFAAAALDEKVAEARAVAATPGEMDAAARHRLRIALKKLRYVAQTFRSLYAKTRRAPYMAALARLQDAFGALNDAATAERLAEEAAKGQGKAAMRVAGFICGCHAVEAEAAMAAADAAWAEFDAMAPYWREEG